MPYVIFMSICFAWSISFMLMKKAGLAFSPVSIAWWRVVAGSGVLGLLWLWRGRKETIRGREAAALLIVALAGCAWPYFIQPWLIARNGSAFMALMVSFVPLLTILISLPVLGARPSFRQSVGVGGAIVCMAVLMWDGMRRAVPLQDIGLALSVPLCYAIANTAIRKWLPQVAPLFVTLCAFVVSAIALSPIVWMTPSPPTPAASEQAAAIGSLAFLGIVGTGIATFLFNKLIHDHGPLFAGMTTNIVPLGAVLVGWLDAEQVTPWQCGALVGIVFMVALVQFRAATRRPEKQPS